MSQRESEISGEAARTSLSSGDALPPEMPHAGLSQRDLVAELDAVDKSFGETRALQQATLRLAVGEMHGLVGENGSGKTTMIKVLSGVVTPDSGAIRWRGAEVSVPSPRTALALGISTVFQETLIIPEQSVLENVAAGRNGLLRRSRSQEEEIEESISALASLGVGELDIHRPAWTLSLAERQIVTIARAIARPWSLLILDEGTSALDADRRDRLFAYLRSARDAGKTILFTSHRMDEVTELADRVTVLRSGSTVADAVDSADVTSQQILEWMAGRTLATVEADLRSDAGGIVSSEDRRPALIVDSVALRRGLDGQSLVVHSGEVFGLAGLEGQGQLDFAETLVGLKTPESGSVSVRTPGGETHKVGRYASSGKLGLAYVPRDRKTEGLFFALSVRENFGVSLLASASRWGLLQPRKLTALYEKHKSTVRLKAGHPAHRVGTLSGGNQQKVLLARWLATSPDVLVLNDPFRGVDANTKAELYPLIRELATSGLAVVLLSTEIQEILTLCDRVAVFHQGGIQTILDTATIKETDVVAAMFGENPDSEEST